MSIDYATIHLCNALLNLSYGGMLLALWVKRKETHLLLWASSLLLVSAAVYGFTLTRNPTAIAVLLAAVSANISLTWGGARSFDGLRAFHWTLVAGPIATLFGYLALSSMATRMEANAFATVFLAINVTLAGLYFLKQGVGFARKVVGWVLLAYAPIYLASVLLDYLHPGSQMSSILILVGDFVLNNAFVVGLFAIMEERARHELRQLAVTDQLTGALNRAGFLGKFPGSQITDARAILIADLDYFKGINDTFGHSAGDAALKAFVLRVRELLHSEEYIARLGGEEFGILLSTGDLQDASLRAEQIRVRLADDPVIWNGKAVPVTASIGVAVSNGPEAIEAAIARADAALYRAKRGGRNRVAA